MFDKQKAKELQQRSHTRGLLSKQFYHNEQLLLQRKRKEMKEELDRQVQERRRLKEHQKMEQDRKIKKQEEEIKNYYKNMENRDKRASPNDSQLPNMKQAGQPYQTYPNESHHDSRSKGNKNRGNSKPNIVIEGDIPLLPVMPADTNAFASFQGGSSINQGILSNSKSKVNVVSSGAIPLLDLSEQQHTFHAVKSKKGKKTKRQRTLQGQHQKQSQIEKIQMSRPQQLQVPNQRIAQERRSTLAQQQSIMGSVIRNGNSLQKKQYQGELSLKEIEEVQQENNSLKVQLKKNQQAISLLMGAVRTNGKLEKFRVQAEKILTGNMQSSMASKKEQQKKEEGLMLPRINLRNQSIMQDYLISAHRRGKKSLGK